MIENRKIESIQLLRLLAAVSIIVFHSDILGQYGDCGVELLFIVSGFVIMKSTEQKKDYFLLRRFVRVVPLYWLSTVFLFFILLVKPELSIMSVATKESLIRSLLFLPQNSTSVSIVPIVSVGWTINYEIYFYVIFSVALKMNHKYRGLISSLLIFFLCGIAKIPDSFFVSNMFDSILLECVWGIVLYYLYLLYTNSKSEENVRNRVLNYNLIVVGIIVYVYLWFDGLEKTYDIHRCLRLGIPAILFCSIFIYLFEKRRIPKWVVELGNMTYSVYLVEYFTTKVYKQLVSMFSFSLIEKIVLFIVMFLLTFGISFISYQLIEKRFTQVILNKFVYRK